MHETKTVTLNPAPKRTYASASIANQVGAFISWVRPADPMERKLFDLCLFIAMLAVFVLQFNGVGLMEAFFPALAHFSQRFIKLSFCMLIIVFGVTRLRTMHDQTDVLPIFFTQWARETPWRSIATVVATLTIVMTCFSTNKRGIIKDESRLIDGLLTDLDRSIFNGTDPWRITHSLFDAGWMNQAIDIFYHPAFFPMFLGVMLSTFLRSNKEIRYVYITATMLCWIIIGMFMASLLPSAGPIYNGTVWGEGILFADLHATLDGFRQEGALFFTPALQDRLLSYHVHGIIAPHAGISAMPSMHVSLALLFALACCHLNRWAGLIMLVYAFFTLVASVHLGWHYAVDGMLSSVLTLTIWLLTLRYFRLSTSLGGPVWSVLPKAVRQRP